ncbi:MAG: cupredoxin domain-containing protein [Thermoplasmata archaeon]
MAKEQESKRKIDRPNVIAGAALVLVLIGIPFGSYFYQFNIRQEQMAQDNVIEILAYKEENGGWTLDEIKLKRGETYTIRLLAIDVTHGFAVDEFNISMTFTPGHPKEVTITPTQTGTFEFYCTVYCSELHSSMRGTVVVT